MMYGWGNGDIAWWLGAHWFTMLLGAVMIVLPFWRIFAKAGFSGWLSLLMIVPMVNLIALYVLAFSDWPIARRGSARDTGSAGPDLR